MRPTILLTVGAVLIVVAIAAVAAALAMDGREDDVGEMVLATAVNEETGEPLGDFDSFGSGTTSVFAAIPVADADEGETFEFRWQGAADDEPVTTQFTVTEPQERDWVYSELVTPDGMVAGTYTVIATREGGQVADREFTVTE